MSGSTWTFIGKDEISSNDQHRQAVLNAKISLVSRLRYENAIIACHVWTEAGIVRGQLFLIHHYFLIVSVYISFILCTYQTLQPSVDCFLKKWIFFAFFPPFRIFLWEDGKSLMSSRRKVHQPKNSPDTRLGVTQTHESWDPLFNLRLWFLVTGFISGFVTPFQYT